MREEVAGQQPAYSPLLFSVLSPYGHNAASSRSAPAARREHVQRTRYEFCAHLSVTFEASAPWHPLLVIRGLESK